MIDPGKIMFNGEKGDVICRPSHWTDVATFFLANYALHAFTVLTEPGSGAFITICDCIRAILLPYTGSLKALIYIFEFAISGSTTLDKAKRARSLCMVVPKGQYFRSLGFISPNLFNIHGQHPIPCRNYANPFCKEFWSRTMSRGVSILESPEDGYRYQPKIAPVPETFTVQPILDEKHYQCEIASNYSVLKTCAAITQIIYGSWELYEARGLQINRFGYAAYSLTVIPYVFMSFLNLVASICRPSYPSLYIVYYRGKVDGTYAANEPDWVRGFESNVSGAVGYAYGDPEDKRPSITSTESVPINILLLLLLIAPYVVIGYMTGFQQGNSTGSQRFWIVSSLVLGQIFTILIQHVLGRVDNLLIRYFGNTLDENIIYCICSIILSAPTIGAFFQVAQMIRQDDICVKI